MPIDYYDDDLTDAFKYLQISMERKMRFVITFSYKPTNNAGVNSVDKPINQFYCFESTRRPFNFYEDALKIARQLASANPDKLVYVTKILSVSEFTPPVPIDPVETITFES